MGEGRRTFRLVPWFHVAQDCIDGRGAVNEANDLERTAATGTDQQVGFVYLLNQVSA
jgi:hypothetical protein